MAVAGKKTSIPPNFQRVVPLDNQAHFSLVDVFHESLAYDRNYTLPYDMVTVCVRAEGKDASVSRNLETGEVYRARENDISLIPHNLPQHYQLTRRCERYGIHFRLELYPGVDVFSGVRRRIVENSPELRREADAIFSERDPILLLSRCREFALAFCHRHWPDRYPLDLERIKRFAGALRFIRAGADAQTSVGELAAVTGRSKSNFTREFHAAFGVSPKVFLRRELLQKAMRLLPSPEESVKSVAHALNFSSEFYFSKFFRRLSGIAPREYRRRAMKSAVRDMLSSRSPPEARNDMFS